MMNMWWSLDKHSSCFWLHWEWIIYHCKDTSENHHRIDTRLIQTVVVSECVEVNVPLDTLSVLSGTISTGQMTKPPVSKHCRKPVGRQRSGLNPTRTTPPCYNNTTLGNHLYAQRKGPNVTNPICWTCKNCSHKCAVDCEHCVTQCSTEMFW